MDEGWRSEILNGVDEVRFNGLPGVILVFGESAAAVITNGEAQVLCAVAELGKGRVVVFSHSSLLNDFEKVENGRNGKFNKNVIKWVSRGTEDLSPTEKFERHVGKLDQLPPTCSLLTWSGWPTINQEAMEQLIDWIENGGGLICGCCPWGVAQGNKIPVYSLPLNPLLHKIGMAFAGESTMKKTHGDRVLVVENLAHISKISTLSEAFKSQPDSDESISTCNVLIHHVVHLPDELFNCHQSTFDDVVNHLSPNNDHVPREKKTIKDQRCKNVARLHCHMMIRHGLQGLQVKANGISHFPGIVDECSEFKNVSLEFSSFGLKKYEATGCYIPAGVVLEVYWQGNRNPWKLQIGAHMDQLKDQKEFERWPQVMLTTTLLPGNPETCNAPLRIVSPFGGLIYLRSPEDAGDTIVVNMHNVVRAPKFTYDTAEQWADNSKYPGTWCDIIGERVSFTLPSKSVRELTDLPEMMKLWDSVVDSYIELLGKDPSNGRGQWFVADIQPSRGAMHAGYPIVSHLNVANEKNTNKFQFNKESFLKGNMWGHFHELGHNFQDGMWTWKEGTLEVTCNVFTLYAMDKICGIPPWNHPWLQNQMKNVETFFEKEVDSPPSNAGVGLFVYAQLIRDFGWESYKAVFRTYNDLPKKDRPKEKEEKMSVWIKIFSEVTKKNLGPLFDFWGWPVEELGLESISEFPTHFPADIITNEIGAQRARAIRDKYKIVDL